MRRDELYKQFFDATQQANDARDRETRAVVRIQAAFRASVVRWRFHEVARAARMIQRCARGRFGRVAAASVLRDRARFRHMQFFHHCSTTIQKTFRAFWSRKYLHDFYARKAYLGTVVARGDRVRDFLNKKYEQEVAGKGGENEIKLKEEFQKVTSQLHHLVSTKAIPGIYNPPYCEEVPKAFGKPVETHLRETAAVKLPTSLRRPFARRAMGGYSGRYGKSSHPPLPEGFDPKPTTSLPPRQMLAMPTANVGRLNPIQGPFRSREQIAINNAKSYQQRSIQQESGYDLVDVDRKRQERLAKLTRIAPSDFMWKKPAADPFVGSVHAETTFQEKPLQFREDYTELPKIPHKPPFFTATKRNKPFTEYNVAPLTAQGGI